MRDLKRRREEVRQTVLSILEAPALHGLECFHAPPHVKNSEGWVLITRLAYAVTTQLHHLWPGTQWVQTQTVRKRVEELLLEGKVQAQHGHGHVMVRLTRLPDELHLTPEDVAVTLREQVEWERQHGRARA